MRQLPVDGGSFNWGKAYGWFDMAFSESKAAFQGEYKKYKAFYLQEKARR